MVPFLPKTIANRAIAIYVTSLCVVSFIFMEYRMLWGYVVLGLACVLECRAFVASHGRQLCGVAYQQQTAVLTTEDIAQ